MKIVVFGSEKRVGALAGERVVDLNRGMCEYLREHGESRAEEKAAERVPARLLSFIERGAAGTADAQQVVDHFSHNRENSRVVYDAAQVKIHAPWPERRIACVGGNYAAHLAGMWANRLGKTDVSVEQIVAEARKAGQWGFWKVPAEVAGPDDPIPFPKRVTYFDYEGEIAIVIGKRGKDIPAAQVKDYVWGVTLFHDWSIRDIGGTDRVVSYNLQKNFDGAVSMGPCIVVGEADPFATDVETYVNGDCRQAFNTRDMVFSFAEYLEYLSRDLTLYPGDIISGGTAAGTAADSSPLLPDGTSPPDRYLKPGDTVEILSPAVGSLRARIVEKQASE